VVDELGGSMAVEARSELGTCFRVTLRSPMAGAKPDARGFGARWMGRAWARRVALALEDGFLAADTQSKP